MTLFQGVDILGFKFRKSVKIAPGIRLNFNKKSTGITFGGKGAHYTINSKGKRTKSIGIPGTGLYYSTTSSKSKGSSKPKDAENRAYSSGSENFSNKGNINMNSTKWYQKTWGVVLMLVLFFPAGLYLMWKYTGWSKGAKIAVSVVCTVLLLASGGAENPSESSQGASEDIAYEETTQQFTFADITTETTTEITTATTTETVVTEAVNEYYDEYIEEETTENDYFAVFEDETTEEYSDEYYYEEESEEYYEEEYEEEYYEEGEYYEEESEMVWVTATGSKYHSIPDCGNTKSSRQVTLETAQRTCSACSKCW